MQHTLLVLSPPTSALMARHADVIEVRGPCCLTACSNTLSSLAFQGRRTRESSLTCELSPPDRKIG